jgi:hypothetical protein
LYLVAALLVGAIIIAWAGRWRRAPRSVAATASDQLAKFRSLYDKGQMTREEFERIRARLGEQIRSEADVPAPAPAAPGPQPASTATPPPPPPANGRPADEAPPDGIQPK